MFYSHLFKFIPRKLLLVLVLISAGICEASAQQTDFQINLGDDSRIIYNLSKGSYTVICNGSELIKNAYLICKTDTIIDSRQAGKAAISVSDFKTALGKGKLYTVRFSGNKNLRQLFYVFPGRKYFITRLELTGTAAAGYMAPLVADNLKLKETGDNRALFVPFDNDMWTRFNAAPLEQADFNSSEVTAIYNADNNRGLVIGSLEQDVWKSGIALKGNSSTGLSSINVFAGLSDSVVTHDRIPHGKVLPVKGKVYSPQVLIGYFDDWRTGLETYARSVRDIHPRSIFDWKLPTPMGWNSWGVLKEKVTYEQAIQVVDFFADSLKNYRTVDNTLFIDLDSFWDNMTPGGIGGDITKLKAFVEHCKLKGLKPGIYWAPFTDWGKTDSRIDGDSSGYTYGQLWTTQNGRMLDIDGGRALDPTHPATRHRISYTINLMKALGFEMIKIDFLGHAAQEADKFYDPAVTTGMQAYKRGMEYLDSVLGRQMLVYAAISPTLATARYAHMRRVACDAWSSIDHTEYTLNSTGYGWWQSHLYDYIDADHVVFGQEEDGVNRARFASALVTGTVITGDDFSSAGKWRTTARHLLQNKNLLQVTKDGKSFRPLKANTGNRGVELFVKTVGKDVYIACFNYSDKTKTVKLPVTIFQARFKGWKWEELFSGKQSAGTGGMVVNIPSRDAAIYLFRDCFENPVSARR
ncbi:MAG: alpha-galactosidase [Chitinophagaceae bacterium]